MLIQVYFVNSDINEDLREFFITRLESMALNFVQTLKELLSTTIEKVWNAIIDALYNTIESVI